MLLKFAIKDFIDDRRYKNMSNYTLAGYERTLSEFHDYCVQNDLVDTADISPSIIKRYFVYCLEKRNNSHVTLNHKLINLRAFFNYLQKEPEIYTAQTNPMRKVSRFKTDVRIDVFTDQQIAQMFTYFRHLKTREKTFYSYRDTTLIVLLLGTGMRRGEVVNLRWKDVDFGNNAISVFGKKRMLTTIPMTEKLRRELVEFHLYTERKFKSGEPEYVFTAVDGRPMTETALGNMFKRLQRIMNFKDVRLSCHTFRHTFAHRCIMSGMDAFTLQSMLRHTDLDMTKRYVAMWGSALKEQNDKFNPLNQIEL